MLFKTRKTFRLFSEHKLRYFFMKSNSFLILYRQQRSYHVQGPESIKVIVRDIEIIHMTSVVLT